MAEPGSVGFAYVRLGPGRPLVDQVSDQALATRIRQKCPASVETNVSAMPPGTNRSER